MRKRRYAGLPPTSKLQVPGLDLNEPDVGFLLQLGYQADRPVVIDIGSDEITMSWPYGAEDVAPALGEVRTYLPVFERNGYVAYDPQLERVFDPEHDAEDARQIHRHAQDLIADELSKLEDERLPWWKRLLR
jgi:hypothetical protein